jgi:hypothetical protein
VGGSEPQSAGEQLDGGVANSGSVIRSGDEVHRPAGPHAEAIHELLGLIRARGFEGVPRPLGLDGSRERLQYIAGDVPVRPFPAWWRTDMALASTASLLRRLHDLTLGIDPGGRSRWSEELADPRGGDVICHNDVCPENVVYRDGIAVAILDFDFAARCGSAPAASNGCGDDWTGCRRTASVCSTRSGDRLANAAGVSAETQPCGCVCAEIVADLPGSCEKALPAGAFGRWAFMQHGVEQYAGAKCGKDEQRDAIAAGGRGFEGGRVD